MLYPSAIFKSREEAGIKLGQELKKLSLKNVVVLAIPSGGIPVGKQVAKILDSPFDLIIVRKIQFPWTTEGGFGAVAADGTIFLGPYSKDLSPDIIKAQTQKAKKEVEHRKKEFLKERKKISLEEKTAILVDDGLAAGSTMFAAIQAVKKQNPKKIVAAIPTASSTGAKLVKPEVDQLISLYTHPENFPFAVASSYHHWHDLSDEEVKSHLREMPLVTK